MRRIDEIIAEKRDEILKLAAEHGVYNVRVFGSVARGEAESNSDVDFLVSVHDGTSVFKLVGLWLHLQKLIGREVSVVDDQAIDGEFKNNALRDAVPL
jgi:predicted nucleotidyltransferase